jgi:rhodanese-related sulfurtransferase
MGKKLLFALSFIPLLLSSCQQAAPAQTQDGTLGQAVSVSGGEYRDITVTELQSMLEQKDFLFVNVHIPFEGDLPDTDLSIPYNEVEQNLDKLPPERDAKIVLYCRSDRMSNIAAEKLVGLGYSNVWNLEGGFSAWKDAGLPMAGE